VKAKTPMAGNVVMSDLSDDDLRKIAMEKNSKGNATSKAMQAQRQLCHRSSWSYQDHSYRELSARDDYHYGESSKFTKRFK